MKLGIIMDPIAEISIRKDSSFAMLLAAQALGWDIHYMEMPDLYIDGGKASARMRRLSVADHPSRWFEFKEELTGGLAMLDVILMRKDPPVDMDYIYVTQLLEFAQQDGACVINDPAALRDMNEKLFILRFPECIVPTLVTSRTSRIAEFAGVQRDIILKPLAGMGGTSVFRLKQDDSNQNVIIEAVTANGSRLVMAQRYIPEIVNGDKRILLIDGTPVPYALARIPRPGDHRGNLAAGGTPRGVELTPRDREICEQLSPLLRDKGLMFVGIDVIGEYLTEINITSPTCIRELDAIYGLDIAGDLMRAIERQLQAGGRRN